MFPGVAKAPLNKTSQRGDLWRVTVPIERHADKIDGCFVRRLAKSGRHAVMNYSRTMTGCFDLRWKSICGYKAAFSWVENALQSEDIQARWTIELSPLAHLVPLPPPPPRAASLSASGAPPESGVSPAVTQRGKNTAMSPPGDAPVAKQPRIGKGATPFRSGDSSCAPTSVDSSAETSTIPASPPWTPLDWMPQKALKLFSGTKLEDPSAIAKYRITCAERLGKTNFSNAYLVLLPDMKTKVVVKQLRCVACQSFLREVDFLSRLRHPNIVRLLDVAKVDARSCIVTEDGGNNLSVVILDRKTKMLQNGPGCSALVSQMLAAVEYLHSNDVCHSDMKPGNIVFDGKVLRLIDIGCAFIDRPGYRSVRTFEDAEKVSIQYGTMPYRAIEIVLGAPDFDRSIDIWALGCIVFELRTCELLFYNQWRTWQELVKGCFAQLGQHAEVGCLGVLPRWSPRFAVPLSSVDLVLRMSGDSLECKHWIEFVQPLLSFNRSKRPAIKEVLRLWNMSAANA